MNRCGTPTTQATVRGWEHLAKRQAVDASKAAIVEGIVFFFRGVKVVFERSRTVRIAIDLLQGTFCWDCGCLDVV
eukprot:m.87273 g.87273  ORF g.87273 m.87273 type:complete len:75 (-) comp26054_c0_seq1:1-225(-)